MELYRRRRGVQTRWASFENQDALKGQAAKANKGAKGYAFGGVATGRAKQLLEIRGGGIICRMWLTILERTPRMLSGLALTCWDGAQMPAISAPLGDFFAVSLGRRTSFECELFSDPEGRSFDRFIPVPFHTGARITLTNESESDLSYLFYMDLPQPIDLTNPAIPDGWCNFYRQDDWSSTAYFYLGRLENGLPPIGSATARRLLEVQV